MSASSPKADAVNFTLSPIVFNVPERADDLNIDLFVVVGSRAMRPWPARDGQNKVLRLDASPEGMNWTANGAAATYESREERSPGSPSLETVVRVRVASRRVYPRA